MTSVPPEPDPEEPGTERSDFALGPGSEPPPPPPAATRARPPADARNWALAAHLSAFVVFVGVPWFVGPLVIWLAKRNDHPFIDDHGKEAVNFNLSMLIYGAVLVGAGVVLGLVTLGLALLPIGLAAVVLGLLWFITTIVATVKASNGETYRYPLTLRLVT